MHLKHIGPLGLPFLTSMFKTALNNNIITHIYKLANTVPSQTRHRQGHLIQAHIPPLSNCKYIVGVPSSLLNRKQTHTKRLNQMTHAAQTITVALDMSQTFDTINIQTLIRKLLHTRIPCRIMKFIENSIKGCKTSRTYINKLSIQRQFKTGVPYGGVLSPTYLHCRLSTIQSPGSGNVLRR